MFTYRLLETFPDILNGTVMSLLNAVHHLKFTALMDRDVSCTAYTNAGVVTSVTSLVTLIMTLLAPDVRNSAISVLNGTLELIYNCFTITYSELMLFLTEIWHIPRSPVSSYGSLELYLSWLIKVKSNKQGSPLLAEIFFDSRLFVIRIFRCTPVPPPPSP